MSARGDRGRGARDDDADEAGIDRARTPQSAHRADANGDPHAQTPTMQNQHGEAYPTRFQWTYAGANNVHLCGSFTNWLETVPMACETHGDGNRVFTVMCDLPPGYHQYKFIVDGQWRHDENQAFIQDPLGNVNNWLYVKPAGGATPPMSSAPRTAEMAPRSAPVPVPGAMMNRSAMSTESGGMDWVREAGGSAGGRGETAARAGSVKSRRTSMDTQSAQRAMSDADAGAESAQSGEADTSGARVMEFLQKHTAYELIPESNKVVVLDTKLPIRQAFHAFYEQGIYAAPLWDEDARDFIGLLSAGDFIDIMRRLTATLADREDLSDADLDQYTIQLIREEYAKEDIQAKPLICVKPEDSLYHVALTMTEAGVHNVPVLSHGSVCPAGGSAATSTTTGSPQLLHMTNLAEVLACLNRHFRGIPSALPLFSQPIGALPIGTWTERYGGSRSKPIPPLPEGVQESYLVRELYPIRAVTPDASIEQVFDVLHGISALPIVNEHGVLMDLYARGDVIRLAANSAYRASIKDMCVAQALGATRPTALNEQNDPSSTHYGRFSTCVRGDTLRTALEMLSLPNIRRLIVVDPTTKVVEGVVSLSDVFSFLIENA